MTLPYTIVFQFQSTGFGSSPEGTISTILFNSAEVAQEVAYTLRGVWDGCNGVELHDVDWEALEAATNLAGGEWCNLGASDWVKNLNNSSSIDDSLMAQISNTYFDITKISCNLLKLPDFEPITFPVSRAEVYWAIEGETDPLNAIQLSERIGLSKSTVQGHLSALEKAGAICSQGRPKQYRLAGDCPQEYLAQLNSCADIARLMRGLRPRCH